MSMWFWMNKAIMIKIDQGTLLVWILNSYCLDHDDVTWYSSKGESSRKQSRGGKNMKWRSFGIIGGARNTR
jgi:hypothetical protein